VGIDNEVYDRLGGSWWDPGNPLAFLHSLTPGRFAYFQGVLTGRLAMDPAGLRVLDIGCGGGFLAERFARIGCHVVGIDPSEVSIATARRHAGDADLPIAYHVGTGERLPVADASVDVAYCCDVLEHVQDLDLVIAETARVLRPGGVYFFDTLNRTFASRLIAIRMAQEWRLTRVIDVTLHDWAMFITPAELRAALARHGLRGEQIVGLGPRAHPATVLAGIVRLRLGRISHAELGRLMDLGRITRTSVSYMGFARRLPTR
jgi:2-polyprenyl-6-hydroxyphenyl methylase / 3-demethylubiquinone-9 3-methyltransferase